MGDVKLSLITRVSAKLAMANEILRTSGKQVESEYWNATFCSLVYQYTNNHGSSIEFAETRRSLERLYKCLDSICSRADTSPLS